MPIEWTCWQAVSARFDKDRLPRQDEFDEEQEEEEQWYTADPFPTQSEESASVPLPTSVNSAPQISLCTVYGSEWKSFFCDTLKVCLKSFLGERNTSLYY